MERDLGLVSFGTHRPTCATLNAVPAGTDRIQYQCGYTEPEPLGRQMDTGLSGTDMSCCEQLTFQT